MVKHIICLWLWLMRDNSELSHLIYQHIHHNETIKTVLILDNVQDAHHAINRLDVGGYIHIPKDAQNHFGAW